MKAFIAITACLGLFCARLNAQEVLPLASETKVYTCRVIVSAGKLAIAWESDQVFKATRTRFLQIDSVALEQADMVFYYRSSTTKDHTWPDFSITLTGPDGKTFSPPAERWQELPQVAPGEKRRALIDIAEDQLRLGQTWQLTITSSLYGNFDCTRRPVFDAAKQWPHWAVAALGAGSIAAALNFNRKKNDNYDLYRQLWRAGNPANEAIPYYNNARQQSKQARTWMAVGIGALALDATLFTVRHRRIRRNQRLYDQFCSPPAPAPLGQAPLSPRWRMRSATPDGNPGISLTVAF